MEEKKGGGQKNLWKIGKLILMLSPKNLTMTDAFSAV